MGRDTPLIREAPTPTLSNSSFGKHTSHTVSTTTTSLTEQDADWIVRRTELRVTQVIAKSIYIQEHCRLGELPCFCHEDLNVGPLIARGGFSNVHRIESFNVTTDLADDPSKSYVIKHLNPKLASEPRKMAVGAKDLVMEAHFLSSLNHKNIIALQGICSAGVAGYAETGRADGFFLLFDELPATLSTRMSRWRQIESAESKNSSSSSSRSLFNFTKKFQSSSKINAFAERLSVDHEIASAVTYLHSHNILYRDLKPGNCGFDRDEVLKIFDFGLAVELPHSEDPGQLYNLAGNTGTARYMAPEIIQNRPYNLKADVFSFTTLLWEILALQKPFPELSGPEVKEWISDFGNRPIINKHWPATVRKLMKDGWQVNIDSRPTMREVQVTLAAASAKLS